jgi:hypothetical protein
VICRGGMDRFTRTADANERQRPKQEKHRRVITTANKRRHGHCYQVRQFLSGREAGTCFFGESNNGLALQATPSHRIAPRVRAVGHGMALGIKVDLAATSIRVKGERKCRRVDGGCSRSVR